MQLLQSDRLREISPREETGTLSSEGGRLETEESRSTDPTGGTVGQRRESDSPQKEARRDQIQERRPEGVDVEQILALMGRRNPNNRSK